MGSNTDNGIKGLDMLAVMSFCIQLMTLSNITSDDIYKELHKQDSEYLEKIAKQNDIIIEKLDKLALNG